MTRVILAALASILFSAHASAENTSVFTPLDLDACTPLASGLDDESGSWKGRCRGLGAVALTVSEGDLRFDLDAGVPNERFETAYFFNIPHTTLEWRLDSDGTPFALIHRFWSSAPAFPGSALGVSKIGTPGEPGCMVALIKGDIPDANARATAFADAILDRIKCSDIDTFLIIN